MGATLSGTSSNGKKLFPDQEEYHRWPLEAVEAAHKRWQNLARRGEPPNFHLTRRQFWDVFTDYNQIVGGTFLSLPVRAIDG